MLINVVKISSPFLARFISILFGTIVIFSSSFATEQSQLRSRPVLNDGVEVGIGSAAEAEKIVVLETLPMVEVSKPKEQLQPGVQPQPTATADTVHSVAEVANSKELYNLASLKCGIKSIKRALAAGMSLLDLYCCRGCNQEQFKAAGVTCQELEEAGFEKCPEVVIPKVNTIVAADCVSKYLPYFEFGVRGIDYSNQQAKMATSYDLFMPIISPNKNQLLFTDLRIFDQSGSSFVGNAQLGYRHLFPEGESGIKQMFGVYGSFDRMHSNYKNYYNQITLGVEYWLNDWFVGGNVYLPIGRKDRLVKEDIGLFLDRSYEKIARGVDGEIGYALTDRLTGYLGGFYFSGKNIKTVKGFGAKVEYVFYENMKDRILGIFDSAKIRFGLRKPMPSGLEGFIELKLRIGMNPACSNQNLSPFEMHMVDLIRRDSRITTSVYDTREVSKSAITSSLAEELPPPSDLPPTSNPEKEAKPVIDQGLTEELPPTSSASEISKKVINSDLNEASSFSGTSSRLPTEENSLRMDSDVVDPNVESGENSPASDVDTTSTSGWLPWFAKYGKEVAVAAIVTTAGVFVGYRYRNQIGDRVRRMLRLGPAAAGAGMVGKGQQGIRGRRLSETDASLVNVNSQVGLGEERPFSKLNINNGLARNRRQQQQSSSASSSSSSIGQQPTAMVGTPLWLLEKFRKLLIKCKVDEEVGGGEKTTRKRSRSFSSSEENIADSIVNAIRQAQMEKPQLAQEVVLQRQQVGQSAVLSRILSAVEQQLISIEGNFERVDWSKVIKFTKIYIKSERVQNQMPPMLAGDKSRASVIEQNLLPGYGVINSVGGIQEKQPNKHSRNINENIKPAPEQKKEPPILAPNHRNNALPPQLPVAQPQGEAQPPRLAPENGMLDKVVKAFNSIGSAGKELYHKAYILMRVPRDAVGKNYHTPKLYKNLGMVVNDQDEFIQINRVEKHRKNH